MDNQRVTLFHVEIPLIDRFATAMGVIDKRSLILVRIGDDPYGWGEAAPYPGQDESIDDARLGEMTPTLSAAIDEATADRDARLSGASLGETIGVTVSRVPVSLAVGFDDPLHAVERAFEEGASRFKLKIAPDRVGHVDGIRLRFPDAVIGVDANGSFGVDTIRELAMLSDLDIAFIEQPVADPASEAAHQLRETVKIPVFVDESVRSVADARTVLESPLVDGVVVKPGRLGWSGALAVRKLANAAGKQWRASGLLETGIGRAYTDILAACPDASISDVAPAEWILESGLTETRFDAGFVSVPRGSGLGVAADPDLLDRYLVSSFDLP